MLLHNYDVLDMRIFLLCVDGNFSLNVLGTLKSQLAFINVSAQIIIDPVLRFSWCGCSSKNKKTCLQMNQIICAILMDIT